MDAKKLDEKTLAEIREAIAADNARFAERVGAREVDAAKQAAIAAADREAFEGWFN